MKKYDLPRISRVLALILHSGSLQELSPPRNRCLQRYGMKEEHKWLFFPSYRNVYHATVLAAPLRTASEGMRAMLRTRFAPLVILKYDGRPAD